MILTSTAKHETEPMRRISPILAHLLRTMTMLMLAGGSAAAQAQISFTTAVDLALKNSPRVQMAQADVARSKAGLEEARDVYIPSVSFAFGGGGYGYGFPLGQPTIFSFTAQSMVFSFSQKDYIRSARSGLIASNFALKSIREQVAEDTAITYLSLDRAQQQRAALANEAEYAKRLEDIVKDRLDAGQDTAMEYTKARRTGVQIRLQLLQLDDEIAGYVDHLSRLIGIAAPGLKTVSESIPSIPGATASSAPADSFAVEAAFATARSKLQTAFGDHRYAWRPQLAFGAVLSRLSTYNNAYTLYYPSVAGKNPNAAGFSVSLTVPLFDASHSAKARGTMADAIHSEQEARYARQQESESRLKLQHSAAELTERANLAALDKDLAQEQLEVILVQLQQPAAAGAPPVTPKDEQNARILERQRYIEMLDADFQARQVRITLMRQSGELETWLKSASRSSQMITPP